MHVTSGGNHPDIHPAAGAYGRRLLEGPHPRCPSSTTTAAPDVTKTSSAPPATLPSVRRASRSAKRHGCCAGDGRPPWLTSPARSTAPPRRRVARGAAALEDRGWAGVEE